jgi:hypothetical protein
MCQRTPHNIGSVFQFEWLRQIVKGPFFDGSNRGLKISESRHDDNRCVVRCRSQLLKRRQAVHPGQPDIEQNRVRHARGSQLQRFFRR